MAVRATSNTKDMVRVRRRAPTSGAKVKSTIALDKVREHLEKRLDEILHETAVEIDAIARKSVSKGGEIRGGKNKVGAGIAKALKEKRPLYRSKGKYGARSRPFEPPRVETGTLHGAIRWEKIGSCHYRVGVSDAAPYAVFLEFGTKNMVMRPFLRPALWKGAQNLRKRLATLRGG